MFVKLVVAFFASMIPLSYNPVFIQPGQTAVAVMPFSRSSTFQGTGIVSDKRLGRTVDILIWQRLERSL